MLRPCRSFETLLALLCGLTYDDEPLPPGRGGKIVESRNHYLAKAPSFAAFACGMFLVVVAARGGFPGASLPIEALGWRIALTAIGSVLALFGAIGTYHGDDEEESTTRHTAQNMKSHFHEGTSAPLKGKFDLKISPLIFLVTACVAVVFELDVLPKVKESRFKGLLEHIIVALLISSFLGLTYEWLLSKKREKAIRKLLNKQSDRMEEILSNMFQVYAAATPQLVLNLIRDVAAQTKQTPTLYRPPRDKDNEYTFANNAAYFQSLINFRRDEVCSVIRKWLQDADSPDNIRFLASDFIGRFELYELTSELRKEATIQRSRWDEITDERKKGWILNYIWAYSCADSPKYRSLGEFLCGSADEWAQRWILFVPLQMPDPELGPLIDEYLQSPKSISEANLTVALRSLAFLHSERACNAKDIIRRSAHRFQTVALQAEVEHHFRKVSDRRSYGRDEWLSVERALR